MTRYRVRRIADMLASDRPRERLARAGSRSLGDAELLAILLGTGNSRQSALDLAQSLLARVKGLDGLQRMSFAELCTWEGMARRKAAQIMAALELGRRSSQPRHSERPAMHSPQDVANIVMSEMLSLEQEHLWVLLCDTRNRLLQQIEVYKGSLNAASVRVGEVFREAIRANAAGVVVVHNHPSGDPTPSPEDISLTRAIVAAGRMLDIEVLDHVIVGRGGFRSLKGHSLGFD